MHAMHKVMSAITYYTTAYGQLAKYKDIEKQVGTFSLSLLAFSSRNRGRINVDSVYYFRAIVRECLTWRFRRRP